VKIPPHKHDADELIYVIAGRGTTLVGGAPQPVAPGALVTIPAGAEHSLTVDEKLTAVQVYAPGGPEQRFKNPNAGSKK
jgi:quercetin dioxygenase-like cupin family protein